MSNNPFEFVGGGKRYLTYNCLLRKKFGCKVMRLPLDCGFSCPNKDGTKGHGGCTYCSSGSAAFVNGLSRESSESITSQLEKMKSVMDKKWKDGLYIPYFQSGTNTYCEVSVLSAYVEEALAFPNVCGISISTRPDCITEEMADYLQNLSERTYLTVELGLQSISDVTAERINRCHTLADFKKGYDMLDGRNINICVHLINGLPGENAEMMLDSVRYLSKLRLHAVKLHLLYINQNTAIADEYANGQVYVPSLEEYTSIICDQLELLPPDVCVMRLTGDGNKDELIAPMWSTKKFVVMNEIDKEMRRRDSFQGKYYKN